MLKTCFYFLINMSISGSMVIMLLLIVRKIRILPKRLIYPLWLIAMLRLSLPIAISSSVSIFNFFSEVIKKLIPVGKMLDTDFTATNYFNAASSYFPIGYKTQRLSVIFNTGTIIWSVGVLLALLTVCVLYSAVFYQFRNSTRFRDNVYLHANATSPFLMGIIIPKIILPTGIDINSSQATHIIAHEKAHKKRGDNLWRLIGLIVTCLHWFNPIVWVGFSCFLKDMELSCDEVAIKNYDIGKRKEYAKSLLAIAEKSQRQNPIPVAFGQSNAKTRVVGILTYQRISLLGTAVSIGFLLVIAIMLITNPKI